MQLEALRGGRVGDVALHILGTARPLVAAFHHHATEAHRQTIQCCVQLASGDPMGGDPRMGVVEWWRTVEGVVALLFRLAEIEQEMGLRPSRVLTTKRRPDVLDRWAALRHWFSNGEVNTLKQTNGLLTELRDFRNDFEHASWEGNVSRRHSKLVELPVAANEADVLEAAAICAAVIEHVRYVIPGTDLMPNVAFPSRQYGFYDQLDSALQGWIMPLFMRALEARGLTSSVVPYVAPPHLQGQSLLPAQFVIRYQDEHQLPEIQLPVDAGQLLDGLAAAHPRCPERGADPCLPDYRYLATTD